MYKRDVSALPLVKNLGIRADFFSIHRVSQSFQGADQCNRSLLPGVLAAFHLDITGRLSCTGTKVVAVRVPDNDVPFLRIGRS